MFAHRGGTAHAPENTIQAFETALEMGATGLESDVWLTADGVVVLSHDGAVGRRWRKRPIAGLDRAQLPPRMASLDDLYDVCGTDFELSLDVSDPRAAEPVVAAASARGRLAVSRLWLCSGSEQRLGLWRRLHPDLRLVYSRGSRTPADAELGSVLARLGRVGIDAVNIPERLCTSAIADACHRHGLRLFAWGVRSARAAGALAQMGVDGVMGDDVTALREGLASCAHPDA